MLQIDSTEAFDNAIGPYKVGVATYFLTAMAMWIGSKMKHYPVKVK